MSDAPKCVGCLGPLRVVQGMATCDTPDCYGNLVYWGLATEPEFSLTLTVPI